LRQQKENFDKTIASQNELLQHLEEKDKTMEKNFANLENELQEARNLYLYLHKMKLDEDAVQCEIKEL
jgi:hypothetical protein